MTTFTQSYAGAGVTQVQCDRCRDGKTSRSSAALTRWKRQHDQDCQHSRARTDGTERVTYLPPQPRRLPPIPTYDPTPEGTTA